MEPHSTVLSATGGGVPIRLRKSPSKNPPYIVYDDTYAKSPKRTRVGVAPEVPGVRLDLADEREGPLRRTRRR